MINQQSNTDRALQFALWIGVAVLVAIGIIAAVGRGVSIANGGLALDQIQRLFPAKHVQEVYDVDRWFVIHPVLILMQIIPGSLFLLLAPFQFSSRIRSRHLQFHRWSGRVLVVAGLIVGLSGLALGAVFPYGGLVATSAVFAGGTFFLFALIRAVIAIRRGDVLLHREWMIRMFAIGLGIAMIRIVGLALFAITGQGFREMAGISFWSGWVITLGTAELWIRRKKVSSSEFRVSSSD